VKEGRRIGKQKGFKINGFSKFSMQLSFILSCLTFFLPKNKDAFAMQMSLIPFVFIQY